MAQTKLSSTQIQGAAVNVLDYMTAAQKADPSAVDTQPAIQAAIDSLPASGGIVEIPSVGSGVWLLENAISRGSQVTLRGSGKYSTILRYTGTSVAVALSGGVTDNRTGANLEHLTVQITDSAAICTDCTRLLNSTFRSVRFAWNGAGKEGIGINISTSDVGQTSYYNVMDDVTFDGLKDSVKEVSVAAQRANRWRWVAPTFLSVEDGFVLEGVQGWQVVAPYFDENTGVGITLGASCDRMQFSLVEMESNVGGTLWSVNAACNRLNVLGFQVHAGTAGSSQFGTRAFIVANWDEGIKLSGSTSTTLAQIYADDDKGIKFKDLAGISQTSTAAVNVSGEATISGASTSVSVTFNNTESDAGYVPVISVVGTSGTPATGSNRVWITSRTTTGFTINTEVAPGVGNSLTIGWFISR